MMEKLKYYGIEMVFYPFYWHWEAYRDVHPDGVDSIEYHVLIGPFRFTVSVPG